MNDLPDIDLCFGDTILRRCRWGMMMYSGHDVIIGRALTRYGEFAEDENTLLAPLIKPGHIAVDVGANVGTVSLFLADAVGSTGQVYAFEAQREVFHYLCGNVVMNQHRQVTCINAAVGAREGTIQLPPIDYSVQSNFGSVTLCGQGDGDTRLQTVDSLNLSQCRLIKIDVEGMEPEVLEGAASTFDRCEPVAYVENKKSERSSTVIGFFLNRGYRLYWHFARFYRPDNFRRSPTNVFGNTGDINMLCLPPSELSTPNLPRVNDADADWQADYELWLRRNQA
jgi:FkbM family methyltransferase